MELTKESRQKSREDKFSYEYSQVSPVLKSVSQVAKAFRIFKFAIRFRFRIFAAKYRLSQ